MAEVYVPDNAWDADTEGVILEWCYKDGDQVKSGDVIAELTDEKVVVELEAPATGRLTILVQAGQTIQEGEVVARIDP